MRNACRACRLQRCIKVGMRDDRSSGHESSGKISKYGESQIVTKLNLDSSGGGTPLSFNTAANNNRIWIELKGHTPLMENYLNGLRNFNSGQRSLYTLENPNTMFAGKPQYKCIEQAEFMRMERGSISLLYTMLINFYPPFDTIPQSMKIEIIRYFSMQFALIHRCQLTVQALEHWGASECTTVNSSYRGRIVTHYGCYIDHDSLRNEFPKRSISPEEVGEHIRFCDPLLDRVSDFVSHYKQLEINELEMVAIIAIMLWNAVEKFHLLNPEMASKRTTLFSELQTLCTRKSGFEGGGIRMGQLFCFLQEILVLTTELKESLVVAKIFLTQIRDVWDDEANGNGCPIVMANGSEKKFSD